MSEAREEGEVTEEAAASPPSPPPRDTTPAVGARGGPASWRRALEGAPVALARPAWGDAAWSFLFGRDTSYAPEGEVDSGAIAAANWRMRTDTPLGPVHGAVIHAPVWTWEVPVYFWVGGLASGASFAALAADLAGDPASARTARKVAFGAVVTAPALLIADLGRPGRFLNMLRIFKPRSPMNLGAWCLVAFSGVGAGAVAADLVGARWTARGLGAVQALLGSYLGSYTGVLLATTAVPLWARSRAFLGPIFIATATATGASATRLTLAVGGQSEEHPTHVALARLEAAAMVAELVLSTINERRVGPASVALRSGAPGLLARSAKALVGTGLALGLLSRRRSGPLAQNVASVLYLAGGLAFRLAWVEGGKASARDHEIVARTARDRAPEPRAVSSEDPSAPAGGANGLPHMWSQFVGRTSLASERLLELYRSRRRRPSSPGT